MSDNKTGSATVSPDVTTGALLGIIADRDTAIASLTAELGKRTAALDSLLGWAALRSDWLHAGRSEPFDHPISIARRALYAPTDSGEK